MKSASTTSSKKGGSAKGAKAVKKAKTTPKKTTAKKVAPKKETRHSDVGMKRASKRNKRKTRSDKGKVRQSTIDRWNRNAPLYD